MSPPYVEIFTDKLQNLVQPKFLMRCAKFHNNWLKGYKNISNEMKWPRFFGPPCTLNSRKPEVEIKIQDGGGGHLGFT